MPGRERASAPVTPLVAYTIPRFCEAHDISVRFYFKMRDAGLGPREMRIGRAVRISLKAAADWAVAREQQTDRENATSAESATAGS
jgi:hypothetical protein